MQDPEVGTSLNLRNNTVTILVGVDQIRGRVIRNEVREVVEK